MLTGQEKLRGTVPPGDDWDEKRDKRDRQSRGRKRGVH
jgi:hypothetical protein